MQKTCNTCGSENTYGMSRVVGYYSIIENWNGSKQAEFKARQKGDYKLASVEQTICESVKTKSGTLTQEKQEVVMVH